MVDFDPLSGPYGEDAIKGGGGGPVSGGGGGNPGGGYVGPHGIATPLGMRMTLSDLLRRRQPYGAPSEPGVAYAPGQGAAVPMGAGPATGYSSNPAQGGGYGPAAPAGAPASGAVPDFNSWLAQQPFANNPLMRGILRQKYDKLFPGGQSNAGPFAQGWQGSRDTFLTQGAGAGAFDPMGSQGLLDMIRREAQVRGQQQQGQALMAASYLDHGDPASAGYAGLSSFLGSNNELSSALDNARIQSATGAQGWLRQLLSQMYGGNYAHDAAAAGRQGTDWGALAGGLGAAGIGAIG